MSYEFSGLRKARAISDILQNYFGQSLFPAIFEFVNEHNFLKNWSTQSSGCRDMSPRLMFSYQKLGFLNSYLWLIKNCKIGTKISDLNLAKVAYLIDSLRIFFQKMYFLSKGRSSKKFEVDEPQSYRNTRGGIRGKQILYFCNIETHQPKIFRKCYFDAYFIS